MHTRKRFAAVLPIVELRELYRDKFSEHSSDIRYNPDAASLCRVTIDVELPDWAGRTVTSVIESELRKLSCDAIARIGAVVSRELAKRQETGS